MARITPCAADFDCYVNGVLLRWDNGFGLKARWRAARHAELNDNDLSEGAILATESLREELKDESVTITVWKQEP